MRSVIGGLLSCAVLAVAGCGGGDDGSGSTTSAGPTKAQAAQAFKAQRTALDAIGTDISTTIDAAAQQSDSALEQQFGALAERADAALAGLRGLDVTTAATAKLTTLRTAVTAGARELHAIAEAAGRGDAAAAKAATQRLVGAGQRIAAAERALSTALGLPASTSSGAPGADGKITVTYATPVTRSDRVARQVLQLGGTDGVAAGFTKRFKLPVDLHIAVVTGTVGPHYDPATHTVTVSYGFVDQIAGILRKGLPDITEYELGRELASIDGFILVHELGHAFVDVFGLPITGREEDAVDGLATVFLVDYVKNGDEYAFFAARFFKLLSEMRGVDASSFYDEHSLDAQRAYDIVCTIAGSGEAAFNQVKRLGILPASRLQRCPGEYQQKTRAWKALLAPHVR